MRQFQDKQDLHLLRIASCILHNLGGEALSRASFVCEISTHVEVDSWKVTKA